MYPISRSILGLSIQGLVSRIIKPVMVQLYQCPGPLFPREDVCAANFPRILEKEKSS